ncbi:MAG: hypothetical protein R3F17_10475 [Planctomycetota bacterium]
MLPALLLAALALSQSSVPLPAPVPRRVVAIHDLEALETELAEDPVQGLLEMPLNHLGLLVERRSYDLGAPTEDQMRGVAGILVYLGHAEHPLGEPEWLEGWLIDQIRNHGRAWC